MKEILKNRLKTLKFYFPQLYFLYITAIKGQKAREIYPKPWINAEAVNWLKQNLTSGMKIFEYGSGGSTLFMSPLVEEIISMEHDPVFSVMSKDKIKKYNIQNCRLVFAPPESGTSEKALYSSTDDKYKNIKI